MYPYDQLSRELDRERLTYAEQQRPVRRLLALRRASLAADRDQRTRRSVRRPLWLRAKLPA